MVIAFPSAATKFTLDLSWQNEINYNEKGHILSNYTSFYAVVLDKKGNLLKSIILAQDIVDQTSISVQ